MKILKNLLITLLLTFCFVNTAYSGLIEPKEKPKNLINTSNIDKNIDPKKIVSPSEVIIEKKKMKIKNQKK